MNLISIQYYTLIYYTILLLIVGFTLLYAVSSSGWSSRDIYFNSISANLLFIFLLIFIGLRPRSYIFGDMGTYLHYFRDMQIDGRVTSQGDWGFYYFMLFLSKLVSGKVFIFILAILYIYAPYIAVKRLFPKYYFFAFLFIITSFSFFSYGTNGLRNGLATSFFILGISYTANNKMRWFWFLLAWSFHSSLVLPIFAYLLTRFITSNSLYFKIWFLSIVLSLTMGTFWENFFLNLGFGNSEKIAGYFRAKDLYNDSFSSTGFRWDFLLYSALPVYVAYYFIYKKKFKDKFYLRLVNIYLLVNAFWILVVRASFSNRFAYLSWFMMGLVIVYPFLKNIYWKDQYMRMAIVLFLYFSFTYFMNVII